MPRPRFRSASLTVEHVLIVASSEAISSPPNRFSHAPKPPPPRKPTRSRPAIATRNRALWHDDRRREMKRESVFGVKNGGYTKQSVFRLTSLRPAFPVNLGNDEAIGSSTPKNTCEGKRRRGGGERGDRRRGQATGSHGSGGTQRGRGTPWEQVRLKTGAGSGRAGGSLGTGRGGGGEGGWVMTGTEVPSTTEQRLARPKKMTGPLMRQAERLIRNDRLSCALGFAVPGNLNQRRFSLLLSLYANTRIAAGRTSMIHAAEANRNKLGSRMYSSFHHIFWKQYTKVQRKTNC